MELNYLSFNQYFSDSIITLKEIRAAEVGEQISWHGSQFYISHSVISHSLKGEIDDNQYNETLLKINQTFAQSFEKVHQQINEGKKKLKGNDIRVYPEDTEEDISFRMAYFNKMLRSQSLKEGLSHLKETYATDPTMLDALIQLSQRIQALQAENFFIMLFEEKLTLQDICLSRDDVLQENEFNWNSLPHELKILIFQHLAFHEILEFRLADKENGLLANLSIEEKLESYTFEAFIHRNDTQQNFKFMLHTLKNIPFAVRNFDFGYSKYDPLELLKSYRIYLEGKGKKFEPIALWNLSFNVLGTLPVEKQLDRIKTCFTPLLNQKLKTLSLLNINDLDRTIGVGDLFGINVLSGLKELIIDELENIIYEDSTELKTLTANDLKIFEDLFPNLEHLTIRQFGLSKDFIERLKDSPLLEKLSTLNLDDSCLAPHTPFNELIKSGKLKNLKYLSMPRGDTYEDLLKSFQALRESNLSNLEKLEFFDVEGELLKGLVHVLTHSHPLTNLRKIIINPTPDNITELPTFQEKEDLVNSSYSYNKPYLSEKFLGYFKPSTED